jgi:hypothetical protein
VSDVTVTVSAASASASAVAPHVSASVLAPAATGVASTPPFIVGPLALVYVIAEPGYHLPADHGDPVALGTEFVLVLVFLVVGLRLVATRLVRSETRRTS